MKILDAFRNRRSPDGSADSDEGSTDADGLPTPGYDKLGHRDIGRLMPQLSQLELAGVERYERAHQNRPEVLAKLRYMLTKEPLPDYDTLTPAQIADALGEADAGAVKAVRSYERKFGDRREVLDEAQRVLPTAAGSGKEDRAQRKDEARDRASAR